MNGVGFRAAVGKYCNNRLANLYNRAFPWPRPATQWPHAQSTIVEIKKIFLVSIVSTF